MLLARWEVRVGKNWDQGVENAARGRGPSAAFSSPRSQCFPIPTDPKVANNIFIVYTTLPLNRLTRRPQTIRKKLNVQTSE